MRMLLVQVSVAHTANARGHTEREEVRKGLVVRKSKAKLPTPTPPAPATSIALPAPEQLALPPVP